MQESGGFPYFQDQIQQFFPDNEQIVKLFDTCGCISIEANTK